MSHVNLETVQGIPLKFLASLAEAQGFTVCGSWQGGNTNPRGRCTFQLKFCLCIVCRQEKVANKIIALGRWLLGGGDCGTRVVGQVFWLFSSTSTQLSRKEPWGSQAVMHIGQGSELAKLKRPYLGVSRCFFFSVTRAMFWRSFCSSWNLSGEWVDPGKVVSLATCRETWVVQRLPNEKWFASVSGSLYCCSTKFVSLF